MKKCAGCPERIPSTGPTRCPDCAAINAARSREYTKQNLNHKADRAQYRTDNRDRINELKRRSYKSTARTKTCKDCKTDIPRKGPDRCDKHHSAYWTNYYAEKSARWIKENPERNKYLSNKRHARVLGAVGDFTPKDWQAVLIVCGRNCLCCGKDGKTTPLEADHVQPLSKGGAHSIENIQPLCRSCNASKRTRNTDHRSAEMIKMLNKWSGVRETNPDQSTLEV